MEDRPMSDLLEFFMVAGRGSTYQQLYTLKDAEEEAIHLVANNPVTEFTV